MGRKNIITAEEAQHSSSRHTSYSIAEIMAAGGATAFANKMGKNPDDLDSRLKELPEDAFLTKEEAILALQRLDESK